MAKRRFEDNEHDMLNYDFLLPSWGRALPVVAAIVCLLIVLWMAMRGLI